MLHYADRFKFRHMPFSAPYGSLDYLAAIRQAKAVGGKVIVVDSMSHEHEGPGGLLDFWESEIDRMAGDDWGKRERVKMLAIQKPKGARRTLINGMLQIDGVHFIFCFRAKESAKPVKNLETNKTEVVSQGFMPIAGDEFVFEMTLNALLLPNAGGVPTWESPERGEKLMIKLPIQFREALLKSKIPLDETLGERLAKWAVGGVARPPSEPEEEKPQEGQQQADKPKASARPAEDAKPSGDAESGPAVDDKEPSRFLLAKAWEAGRGAFVTGEERTAGVEAYRAANPSAHPRLAEAWLEGWNKAEEDQTDPADEDPELEDEEESESAEDGPTGEESAPPTGFAAYASAVAEANDWLAIREALQAVMKDQAWKEAGREMQSRARAMADHRRRELNNAGAGIDMVDDPHAFRCFIEAERDAEAIVGTFATFKRQAAWVGLTAPAQAAFEEAVKGRLAFLASADLNGGGEFQ